MKGLLLKDLYLLRKYANFAWIFLIISFIEPSILPVMFVVFIMVLGINTFSYDELAKWDKYANVLPVTRKQIISEKYIFLLISIAAVAVVTLIFYGIITVLGRAEELEGIQFVLLLIISAVTIINAIFYPVIIRFGVQKSRIILFIIAFTPGILVGLAQDSGLIKTMPSESLLESLAYLSPFVALILLLISFFVAVNFYQKKEF